MLKNLPGAWRDTRGCCQSVSPPLFGSGDMGSLALSASTQLQATKPPHCHPDLVFQPQSVADTCVICHSYPEAGTRQISDLPLRGHSLRSVASIFGGHTFPGSPPAPKTSAGRHRLHGSDSVSLGHGWNAKANSSFFLQFGADYSGVNTNSLPRYNPESSVQESGGGLLPAAPPCLSMTAHNMGTLKAPELQRWRVD